MQRILRGMVFFYRGQSGEGIHGFISLKHFSEKLYPRSIGFAIVCILFFKIPYCPALIGLASSPKRRGFHVT